LDELAEIQGLTTPRLISMLHDEVLERYGEISNFASMLRSSCLIFLQNDELVRNQGKFADVA
jgi:predicted DNA-binding ribbon-helix-helix protein